MDPLLSEIQSTLQKYRMLSRGERVLVACSGGADSVALFHLLKELAPRLGLRLHLLHFDHALRRESGGDLTFVKKRARQFRIPFHGGRRKISRGKVREDCSPEEGAREVRYQFFESTAKKTGIRKVALAHHADDQAETVLMRVIQGTGLRGLQGIRPVIRQKGVTYIRPLMGVSRAALRAFLKRKGISFREDRTNRSSRFLRNRVRRELLPLLEKKFNPQVRRALSRLAQIATAESSGLDEWIEQNWKSYLKSRRNGTVELDRDRFLALPAPVQFRLLNRCVHSMEPRSGVDFESWKRIEGKLAGGRLRMTLPRNVDLSLTPKKLFIRKNATM